MLKQQAEQIAAAVDSAFVVKLGGQLGSEKQWGQCLAIKADSNLAQIRSSLGNALAQVSADQGLRAIAVVAYIEVLHKSDNSLHDFLQTLRWPFCGRQVHAD